MLTDTSRAADFPSLKGIHYLNTAAESIPPTCVGEALQEYWRDKLLGMKGRDGHYARAEEHFTRALEEMLLARLKLAVLALVELFTLLEKLVALNSAGMVSLIELVKVDGPAFVTTSVKLVVLPTATVLEPTSLLTLKVTTLVTVPATVAVAWPLLVVPVGIKTVKVLV